MVSFADVEMLSNVLPVVSTRPKPPTGIMFSDDSDCIYSFEVTSEIDLKKKLSRTLGPRDFGVLSTCGVHRVEEGGGADGGEEIKTPSRSVDNV